MPELPDVTVYIEALEERLVGHVLEKVVVVSPFLLRTFDPPIEEAFGQPVRSLRRLGKRIAFGLENDLWLIVHLMIAGRLQWKPTEAKPPSQLGLAVFLFDVGTLVLTEAGSKKRASLHVARANELEEYDPGGLDVLACTFEEFQQSLQLTNRTLKRQLTNPLLFDGIGNAYSDEILHRARLSPIKQTQSLEEEDVVRLYAASRDVMAEWIERLRKKAKGKFPTKVTAFRPEMAVHGKFGEPCPNCGSPIQRIRYSENETNYCATCQNEGQVLADRSLSRLLKDDWPRRIEDWETGQ